MATAAIFDFWNRKRWRASRRISVLNFINIGKSVAKILRFFDFLRWRPPPSWIFIFVIFYWLTVSGGPRRITVPNFVKIGRTFAQILWFFEFWRWRPPLSWILEIAKFYWLLESRGSKLISMPNFVKIGQSVAKILRFFDFSRCRPSAILDSFGSHLDHPQWVLVGLYHCETSGSAMAEGPCDALVSRNSATYKTSHLNTRVSGLSCGITCRRTDRRTDRHTTTRHVPRLA